MAASLTLASPVVAADGKTVTATVAGGSGTGLALGAKTGLSLHLTTGQPHTFHMTSAAVVGTTLTIVLTTPVGTGETVVLDIDAATTLTDDALNTPTGQVNIATTNSSAVTVRTVHLVNDAASLELNGAFVNWTGTPPALAVAGSWVTVTTADALCEFVTDATEIASLSYSGGADTHRIDGATSATTAPGDGTWCVKPLTMSPLAAGKHLVRFTWETYFYGFRISGGTRTLYSVAQTKRTLKANTLSAVSVPAGTPVALWGAFVDTTGTQAGESIPTTGGYVGLTIELGFTGSGVELATVGGGLWSVSVDGGLEGDAIDTDAFGNSVQALYPLAKGLLAGLHSLRAILIGNNVGLYHRGVKVVNGTKTTASSAINDTTLAVASTATLAVNDWVKIDDGLKREHRKITAIAGLDITVAALDQTHASGATVTSYAAAAGSISAYVRNDLSEKRIVQIGDSNTAGYNTLGTSGGVEYNAIDPRVTGTYRACQRLGYEFINLGIQGTDTAQQAGRKADIHTYARDSLDACLIWEGVNDVNGASATPAQYKSRVLEQVTATIPYLRPGGKVWLMPPGTPTSPVDPAVNGAGLNIAICAAKLQEIAAESGSQVRYMGDLLADIAPGDISSLHYEDSGHDKMMLRIEIALGATRLFEITGPTTERPVVYSTL